MRIPRLLFPALILPLTACFGGHDLLNVADMGVTQGGSQDIDLAREIIDGGGIPDQADFTTEGLFSAHDLPLAGERCGRVLCPRGAAALIDPVDDSGQRLLVQLGFGSNINAATFERRALNLSIALDISGSMAGSKIATVRLGMTEMVGQLTEADTVSIVLFNDEARTVVAPTVMDEAGRQRLHRVIQTIDASGGTNIEAGLAKAFEHVSDGSDASGIERRVMLLTDAQPNIGGTSIDTFSGLARHYSEEDIGLTVFGVGLDLGSELATEMSNLPGGNSIYLADEDAIMKVFNEEFDYVVSPIAYNLDVAVDPGMDMTLDQTWAAPTAAGSENIEFGTSTLFLSTRAGGMGITLDFPGDSPKGNVAAEMAMSFQTLTGKTRSDDLSIVFEGGREYRDDIVHADDLGVYKMAYLIDVIIALESAADACDDTTQLETAQGLASKAAERLEMVADQLEDAALEIEAELLTKLGANLRAEKLKCRGGGMY